MKLFLSLSLAAAATTILILSSSVSLVAAQGEYRVLNCKLDSTSISDCDSVSYAIKVGATVAPGILIAIGVFIALFFVICGRMICNCCGGRNQTANVCCPPNENKKIPARYGKNDILRAKIFMFLIAGMAAGAIIWGNTVSANVLSGLHGFGDAVVNTPRNLIGKIDEMRDALTVQVYHSSNDSYTTTNLFTGTAVDTQATSVKSSLTGKVDDAMGTYKNTINDYAFVLFIIFSVPAAVVAIGVPLALCNIRKFIPMLLVWITFIVAIVVWLVHGTFAGTAFVFDGVCTEVSGAANNRQNIITPLIGCDSSMFSSFFTSFHTLRQQKAEAACNTLKTQCFDNAQTTVVNLAAGKIFACPGGTLSCSGITLASFSEVTRNLRVHNTIEGDPVAITAGATCVTEPYKSKCTFQDCAHNCKVGTSLSTVGKAAKSAVNGLDIAEKVAFVIDSLGNQFGHCDSILAFLMSEFDRPCQKLVYGLDGARDASGLQGFTCIGGIFALIFGSKRFISGDEAEKAIYPGEESGETPQKK